MFFILSKILSFLISPFTWMTVCFILAALLKTRRKPFFISGLIVLIIFSNAFILDEFLRKWEIPATSEFQPVSAGIVLGGISDYDPSLKRIQFNSSNDRLMQALILYKTKKIPKIVFTGGSASILHPDLKEGKFIGEFLSRMEVPDSDVILETNSRNTFENAVYLKPILDRQFGKDKTFLLVTSGYHMRRSLAIFEKAGLRVIPYSTDRRSGPRKFQFDHLFIPDIGTLYSWQLFMHELIGYQVYRIRGYI